MPVGPDNPQMRVEDEHGELQRTQRQRREQHEQTLGTAHIPLNVNGNGDQQGQVGRMYIMPMANAATPGQLPMYVTPAQIGLNQPPNSAPFTPNMGYYLQAGYPQHAPSYTAGPSTRSETSSYQVSNQGTSSGGLPQLGFQSPPTSFTGQPSVSSLHTGSESSAGASSSTSPKTLTRYVCEFCGKTFKTPSDGRKHEKIHALMKDRPKRYACEAVGKCRYSSNADGKCMYRGLDKRDKERHERKHTKERPFPCPYCGRAFPRKDGRKRHIDDSCKAAREAAKLARERQEEADLAGVSHDHDQPEQPTDAQESISDLGADLDTIDENFDWDAFFSNVAPPESDDAEDEGSCTPASEQTKGKERQS